MSLSTLSEDNPSPLLFSKRRVKLSRQRSQTSFEKHSFLYDKVMEALVERLSDVKRQFTRALILGDRSTKKAFSLGSDFSCLKTDAVFRSELDLVFEEETLPFKPFSFDLIVNPLTLHWVNDLPGTLAQLKYTLKPDGLFLGALIGGESLYELKYSLLQAEEEIFSQASRRVAPLVNPAMMGALLQRAGFVFPVIDVERVTVYYDHILSIMHDLRGMGETHKLFDMKPLTRKLIERAHSLYLQNFSDTFKLKATFEIIYFIGWTSPFTAEIKSPSPRLFPKLL